MGWIDSTKVDWILFKHSGSLKDLSPLGTKLRDFPLALIVKLRDFFKGPCRTFEDFGRILRVSRLCLGILPCTDCEMEGFLMDFWWILEGSFPSRYKVEGFPPAPTAKLRDFSRILEGYFRFRDILGIFSLLWLWYWGIFQRFLRILKDPWRTFKDFERIFRVSRLCLGILPCTDYEIEGFFEDSWKILRISRLFRDFPCANSKLKGLLRDRWRIVKVFLWDRLAIIKGSLRDLWGIFEALLRDG